MILRSFRFFSLFSLFLGLAACAAETTQTGGSGGPPQEQQDPNAPCSTLVNVAKAVDIVDQAGDPPAPAGGVLVDGTYVVTRAVRYTGAGGSSGPSGKQVQMTVRLKGQDAESIFDNVPRRARVQVDGVNLRTTAICPSSAIDDAPFTASGDTLTLYLHDSKGTRVYSLTRI